MALNTITRTHIPDGFEDEDVIRAKIALYNIYDILLEAEEDNSGSAKGIQFVVENTGRKKVV
jgi:hypothetical protein